jgi:hypothetical protein
MARGSKAVYYSGIVFVLLASSAFAMYCPETGRFMQRDSIGIDPAGGVFNRYNIHNQYTDGVHLYQYVRGQVIIKNDPTGLAIGATGCDPDSGKVYSIISPGTGCYDSMVQFHETIHVKQLSGCCYTYSACKKLGLGVLCEILWTNWISDNYDIQECEAFTEEATTCKKMMGHMIDTDLPPAPYRNRECCNFMFPGPYGNPKCCSWFSYQCWIASTKANEFCSKRKSDTPSVCPFSENGMPL